MKKDIYYKHKFFLCCTVVFGIVFLLGAIAMGIVNKVADSHVSNIVFYVWLGYAIVGAVVLVIFGLLIKKEILAYMVEKYSFDKTKPKKLEKTIFEFKPKNADALRLEFLEDGIVINSTKYSYEDLIFQYSALNSYFSIQLFISKTYELEKDDIMYCADVDKDMYDCLNYYDLNIKELNQTIEQLKTKLAKSK